jgi:hypothetical protein
MSELEIHQRESSGNTESFLQENIKDFKRDLDFVIMLMKNGKRLTAKSLMQEFGIPDRRLRDAYQNREQIKRESGWEVVREWKLSETGKRKVVEYFMKLPPTTTKGQLVAMFTQTELFT